MWTNLIVTPNWGVGEHIAIGTWRINIPSDRLTGSPTSTKWDIFSRQKPVVKNDDIVVVNILTRYVSASTLLTHCT